MIRNTAYKKALNKYGAKGVLHKYMEGKIELTNREWDDLHIRIEKQQNKPKEIELKVAIGISICVGIIFIISVFSVGNYMDQMTLCNKLKGHQCSNYEIDRMGN